jgi:cell division protein FtsN
MKKYLPFFILGLIIATTGCDNINPFKKKVDHALLEQQRQDSIRLAQEAEELRIQQAEEQARLEENRRIEEAERLKALNKYHLVVGSFKVPGNATRYHEKILAKGFDSQIVMAKNGFHLVTMKSYDNFRTAANELRSVTRAGEYEVWLYVQN